MQLLYGSVALSAISAIYYAWEIYRRDVLRRERRLRERVAYMLWVCANEPA
jgi:hypothetical protein